MKTISRKKKRSGKGYRCCSSPFRTVFFLVILLLFPPPLSGKSFPQPQSLIENGSFIVTRDGRTFLDYNGNKQLIPASVIKLVTALGALKVLGSKYRFSTEFYLDNKNNLTIRGGGDPFLVSENITEIARQLIKLGVLSIGSIILDDSAFQLSGPADGISSSSNPYDAVNSALSVNFNSLPLLIHTNGTVESPEPQTPVIPLMHEAAKRLPSGLHRVNISSVAGSQDISLPLRYAGELVTTIFTQEGIRVTGNFRQGTPSPSSTLLYTYQSEKTVEDLVAAMLKYSNNFIANQLFLMCGMHRAGPPATWNKARGVMNRFIHSELQVDLQTINIVEGSGISRNNRVNAQTLIHILYHFKPYFHLLPLLKKTALKSGTLSDVFSYAGYFKNSGNLDPFVIILNQKKNNRARLLQLLYAHYLSAKAR